MKLRSVVLFQIESLNKTTRIMAKPETRTLNVPTAFKVSWSSNNIKKLNVKNIYIFFWSMIFFCENHPPTRHTKYKRIELESIKWFYEKQSKLFNYKESSNNKKNKRKLSKFKLKSGS